MKIWSEKYRPKTLKEVIGQKMIIKRLIAFTKSEAMPHLLFAGPAGVGKTTCALALANDIFKDEKNSNFLELNASDERGIETIRNKVKDFARTKSVGNASFKVIFLGESDALTKDAQQALRRTMEKYSSSCRFILDCNYPSKIIDPIQSRCIIFKFKNLTKEDVFTYLNNICKNENIKINEEAISEIYNVSNGDLRKATNILQSCSVLSKNININLIYDVASVMRPKDIKKSLELCIKGDYISARKLLFDTIVNNGLSGIDVIKQIQQEIINIEGISAKTKIKLIGVVGEFEFRMVEGSNEFVQLESLLAQFFKVE